MANIVLGIAGSIAAYKTPDLVRILKKAGHNLTTILSPNATKFVTKVALSTVSEEISYEDQGDSSATIPHLDLLKEKDLFVVAPASANFIAKASHGMADDLLTTMFISYKGPKLIVPAMHHEMIENPITQDNISRLKKYGIHMLGPQFGELACGDIGNGRMVDLPLIEQAINYVLFPELDLSKKHIVVTAGGTQEKIDSVRVISNLSSGKLGSHIAHMAAFFGAKVTLITAASHALSNPHVKTVKVRSVAEMKDALTEAIPYHDTLYMAAAISDYTVTKKAEGKIRRQKNMTLELEGTPDILKSIHPLKTKKHTFIGFCLEDDELEKVALKKLHDKGVDFIAGNSSESFGSPNRTMRIWNKNKECITKIENKPVIEAAYELLKVIV